MDRFLRTERLLGSERLQLLKEKKVTVIGLGAVGGYVVEGLVRSGISRLRVVDFDRVELSNINRQIYALESTIGEPKVELALKRIKDINPDCEVEGFDLFVHRDTLGQVLDNEPDLVIDAIDSVTPKAEVIATTYQAGLPLISSMGAALRLDPARVKIGDLFRTQGCPLARVMRSRLRKRNIRKGVLCVYSDEVPDFEYIDPENEPSNERVNLPVDGKRGRQRRVLGSLSTVTGIFGLTIANTAIQLLTDHRSYADFLR